MNEAAQVSFPERVTCLREEMNRARGRNRTEFRDELLEVHAFEELHHVVERSVVGDTEIVQLDRMGRAKCRRSFCLPTESLDDDSSRIFAP